MTITGSQHDETQRGSPVCSNNWSVLPGLLQPGRTARVKSHAHSGANTCAWKAFQSTAQCCEEPAHGAVQEGVFGDGVGTVVNALDLAEELHGHWAAPPVRLVQGGGPFGRYLCLCGHTCTASSFSPRRAIQTSKPTDAPT